MTAKTFSEAYKTYSDEDKEALKQLKAEEEARTGKTISLSDMIRALEPGL